MTVCLQCALRALVAGTVAPTIAESPDEHLRLAHPDPVETARERRALEIAVAALLAKK